MKFNCDRTTILREISMAHEIISSRNILAVQSNVLLKTEEGALLIRATDVTIGFETRIPIEVISTGTTLVFCEKLLGALKFLPDERVIFELDGDKLHVKPESKKVNYKLRSINPDDFPEIGSTDPGNYFEVSQKDFIELINQTIFAVSEDETRHFMNGVYFEQNGNSLTMVATDGRRLSCITKQNTYDVKPFSGVIIPKKILLMIRKMASGEGNISLAISNSSIFFEFDNHRLTSNLIDGQFPDYQRVIPKEQKYEVVVELETLSLALNRVSLFVENKFKKIFIDLSENNLIIRSMESESGMSIEEIPCDYKGPDATIALNHSYLSDPIKRITEKEIVIRYSDPMETISIVSNPEKDYYHIVVPMDVN